MGEATSAPPRLHLAMRWPRLRLLRPLNALMAGAGSIVGALLVTGGYHDAGGLHAWQLWAMAAVAAMAIAGFGNVLNDLRDEALDRAAHPHRPLPAGLVRRADAWLLALLSLLLGLFAAAGATLLDDWRAPALAALNACILIAYELGLKVRGLPGNLAVSALVGSTFIFGATAAQDRFPADGLVWLVAGTAAFATLARELLKDIEDRNADAAFRWTFPMQHGAATTRFAALGAGGVAVTLACAALGLDGGFGAQRGPAAALVLLASAILLAGCCLAWKDDRLAQRTLKGGMAAALAGFAWSAVG